MLRSTCLPMPSNLMEPCSIHNGRSVDTHLNTFIKIPSCLLSPACRVCSLQSWESSPWYSWKVGWPSSALRVFPAAPRLTVTSSSFFLLCHSHSNFITLLGFILTRTICHNTKKIFFFFLDKKRKKEDVKVRPEVKVVEKGTEEERKREKPKAHAPSHAKIRSTGLVPIFMMSHWLIYSMFIFCGLLKC